MDCPACTSSSNRKVELVSHEHEEARFVTVDRCETCKGVWLDESELDDLDGSVWTNTEELAFSAVPHHEKRNCPRCAEAMKAISPADDDKLIVDRCEACGGFWLDGGELARFRDIATAKDGATMVEWKPEHVSPLSWLVKRIVDLF